MEGPLRNGAEGTFVIDGPEALCYNWLSAYDLAAFLFHLQMISWINQCPFVVTVSRNKVASVCIFSLHWSTIKDSKDARAQANQQICKKRF